MVTKRRRSGWAWVMSDTPCFSYLWQGKKLRAGIADVWQGKDLRGLKGISCDMIPFGYCFSSAVLGKRLKDSAPFEAQGSPSRLRVEKSRSLDFARDDNLKEALSALRFAEKRTANLTLRRGDHRGGLAMTFPSKGIL
jgi:hypothetical protein